MWQGTVPVTGPGVQDIAHTLAYTNPSQPGPAVQCSPAPGSAAHQVRSDFG